MHTYNLRLKKFKNYKKIIKHTVLKKKLKIIYFEAQNKKEQSLQEQIKEKYDKKNLIFII